MPRTFICPALVLRTASFGESNREAWFLSASEGILRAVVYGGPKSRLRAHVSPFHSGTLYYYLDPVRDSRRVNDFDVRSWRPGLRELYERAMAAAAMADTILASHGGGGNWERALSLAETCLEALAEAAGGTVSRIFTQFLWNWAGFLGLRPDLESPDPEGRPCEAPADELLWFDRLEGEFRREGEFHWEGESRRGAGDRFLSLNTGARRWLLAAQDLDPARLDRITADTISLTQARTAVTALMAGILGKELSSWNF
ncbi:MAG: recombination protein O N-terminal domain-containing protein [Treponema sp.]|jgi:DNA repair protein RecO (recombination protein O)|nr:recombination protein O N-terminal domain-containing protein [Treponema sp.]